MINKSKQCFKKWKIPPQLHKHHKLMKIMIRRSKTAIKWTLFLPCCYQGQESTQKSQKYSCKKKKKKKHSCRCQCDYFGIQGYIKHDHQGLNRVEKKKIEWEQQKQQAHYLFTARSPLLSWSRESDSTAPHCVLCVTSARDWRIISLPLTIFG